MILHGFAEGAQTTSWKNKTNNVCVFVCVCVRLRDGRQGQGSVEPQVASTTQLGHDVVTHKAQRAR